MKRLLLSLIIAVTLFGVTSVKGTNEAEAYSGSSYNILGTTYYNFDGVTGTSYDILGTTYYNFSNGLSGTSYDILGTTYYNWSEPYNYSYTSYDWDY